MDHERERIRADLLGVVDGQVLCDDLTLQMYASDASIYEVRPLSVVLPRHTQDVSNVLRYACEHALPIHARGAGSGLAGESLGPGIVIDFSHSMRRILWQKNDAIRIQPGIVMAQLNWYLTSRKMMFGPDPSTRSVTTMGSVISLDASGSHWLRYGSARDHILSLQCVLADGTIVELNQHDATGRSLIEPNETPPHERVTDLTERIGSLLQRNQEVIRSHWPESSVNRAGYALPRVAKGDSFDLTQLICGSEGTLALVTEATLKTVAIPQYRGVALLFFNRLDSAAHAAVEIGVDGADACDLLDRRLLSIAREDEHQYSRVIPAAAEAMLLVEYQASSAKELKHRLEFAIAKLKQNHRDLFDYRIATETDERNHFWRLARRVIPRLYRLKGAIRAVPFVEDIAVPPAQLPAFLATLQGILRQFHITATLYAHAAHGELHLRPLLDIDQPESPRLLQELANRLYEETLAVKGTISGEHALGYSRTWYLKKQYGPVYDVFREVKRIFDPTGVLNPGKVVADSPQPPMRNLRSHDPKVELLSPDAETSEAKLAERSHAPEALRDEPAEPRTESTPLLPILNLQLDWRNEDLLSAARKCNGCGRCRTTLGDERMCPIFRATLQEEASPRAKANLMRAVVAGKLSIDTLATDEFRHLADLCVNCHQCRIDCPAEVDIPKLMIEAKAQHVQRSGLKFSDWLLARLDLFSSAAAAAAPLVNWAIDQKTLRWIFEKMTGIAQGRKLPRFSRRSFLRSAARRRLTKMNRQDERKVLYFVDTFANWNDVQLAQAFVSILEKNHISVFVHPDQKPAGMSLISSGVIDRARKLAEHNVELLADAVRQGYHIVATEPAAALCLKHEYLNLLGDRDAQLVAENSSEACTYLWELHKQGKLELSFKPLIATVGYHLPCHQRALNMESPGEKLLRLIPGLNVERIEKGCSGMAGTWGLRRENFRRSLRIGYGLISELRRPSITVGATECSACKMQMEQGTNKATIHPLKLLAYAYGLMPEVEKLMRSGPKGMTIT